VLVGIPSEHALPDVLTADQYEVVRVPTGTLTLRTAREVHPDAILVAAELPDISGIELCSDLHKDPEIGPNVPILILVPGRPSPEQRVAALRAGAWDFLRSPGDAPGQGLKLQAYVQAKRNVDLALAGGILDPTSGLHSRTGLARRARELGALMVRTRGALACVVFALDAPPPDARAGGVIARTARVSDVVGVLAPTEFALLAPLTDYRGAVRVARRVARALCDATESGGPVAEGATLRVGFDVATNLAYQPIDPVVLLPRAAAAAHAGQPDPEHPWMRRFDERISGQHSSEAVLAAAAALVLEKKGRTLP